MAVTNDCEHKVPEFLCRHCAGKDRSGGILACDVVPADHKQTKTVERRVLDAATAVDGVHRGPVGLVKKSALDSGDAATPVQANDGGKLATSDDKEADGHAESIAAAMPERAPTVLPAEPVKAGKGGEGGVFEITNAEFIAAAIRELPEGPLLPCARSPAIPAKVDGRPIAPMTGCPRLLLQIATTTSAVRVSIQEMTARSRLAKPSSLRVIF